MSQAPPVLDADTQKRKILADNTRRLYGLKP